VTAVVDEAADSTRLGLIGDPADRPPRVLSHLDLDQRKGRVFGRDLTVRRSPVKTFPSYLRVSVEVRGCYTRALTPIVRSGLPEKNRGRWGGGNCGGCRRKQTRSCRSKLIRVRRSGDLRPITFKRTDGGIVSSVDVGADEYGADAPPIPRTRWVGFWRSDSLRLAVFCAAATVI